MGPNLSLRQWAAGAGIVLVTVVAVALLLEENKPFDLPVAIQQCAASCQQELMGQTANSASLASKMTDLDVEDLCRCSCDGGYKSLNRDQLARLEKMTSTESVRADQGIRSLFDGAFKACYPRYAR